MTNDQVRIKVYSRTREGTIVFWNTDVLSKEQKENMSILIKQMGETNWVPARTAQPNTALMRPMDYNVISTVMILHDKSIDEHTPFDLQMSFGKTEVRNASITIEDKAAHTSYVRPKKTTSGEYAMPITSSDMITLEDGTRGIPVIIVGDLRKKEDA